MPERTTNEGGRPGPQLLRRIIQNAALARSRPSRPSIGKDNVGTTAETAANVGVIVAAGVAVATGLVGVGVAAGAVGVGVGVSPIGIANPCTTTTWFPPPNVEKRKSPVSGSITAPSAPVSPEMKTARVAGLGLPDPPGRC